MTKSKLFLLLTLPLFLVSCGGDTNSNSSSISTNSSESVIEELINEKIGSREKLLTYFRNLDSNVKSYSIKKETKNSYGTSNYSYDISLANNEVKKVTTTSSETSLDIEVTTEYTGLIGDTIYYLYKTEPSSNFDTVTREKFDDSSKAKEEIDKAINSDSIYYFMSDKSQGMGNLFNQDYVESSYRTTVSNDGVTLRTKVVGNATEYMFVAEFDLDLNFIEGSFTKTGYSYADWDEENNVPKTGVKESYIHKYDISNLKFGRESVNETSVSFDGYFIEELNGNVNLYTTYCDTVSVKEIKSKANQLFIDSYIETYSLFDDGLSFIPETALDQSSITITSSSNLNAVYKNAYGSWVTGSTVGEKSTLTIGNSFNPNMIDVEVTLVEVKGESSNEKTNLPIGGSLKEWGIVKLSNSSYIWSSSITLENGSEDTFGLPTDNEGPFTNLDEITISYSTESIVNIQVADMNNDLGGYSAWNVYFDIVALNVGTTNVTIKLNETTLWTLIITVN